jgi:trans-2,3-dihydro-3-hydroxyanthranilate isomerase
VLNLGIGPVPVAFEAVVEGDAGGERAWLHAPAATLGKERARSEAAALLRLAEADLDPELPVQQVTAGIDFLFVPLAGLDALRRARLDLDAHARLLGAEDCVYLFCRESHEPGRQIAARMLFDAGGVREDPATGSASACLGFYLLHHRVFADGPLELVAEQGYEIDRPSLIHIRASHEANTPRVQVGGHIIEVARGQLA